jgi:hypothetical protein
MALNKVALSTAIKAGLDAAFEAAKDKENDGNEIRQNYCDAISDAFDDYVKSMQITIITGQIQVQGTATAQSNIIPIVLTDSVS